MDSNSVGGDYTRHLAFRFLKGISVAIVAPAPIAVAPLLILDKGNVVPSISSFWWITFAAVASAFVVASLPRIPISNAPWTAPSRVIAYVVCCVLTWIELLVGVHVLTNYSSVEPSSYSAVVTDFYDTKKVSNCQQRMFLMLDDGRVEALCANNVLHEAIERGDHVNVQGRKSLLGFAVDRVTHESAEKPRE